MKEVEDFIKEGNVRRQNKDSNLAKALIKSSEKSVKNIKRIKIDELNAESVFSEVYDSIRELIDAVLLSEGYKSYSHEASILYLKKFSIISEKEILFLDNFRKIRNGIKYYGKEVNTEDVKNSIKFMNDILIKLHKILKTLDCY
jgi:uncharacterized protein (UPF0332 family)